MLVCSACSFTESREDLVKEVFCIGWEYILVGGIPATACVRCGELSFSAETAKRVRLMVRVNSAPSGFIATRVFTFTS